MGFTVFWLVGAGSPDGGASAGDDGGGVITLAGDDTPVVAIRLAGKIVCSGVLVDARLVVTAASCAAAPGSASICVLTGGACLAPAAVSFDESRRVAALTLPSDASPTPIPYGRTDAPAVGDVLSTAGYGATAAEDVVVISTDGQIYNVTSPAPFAATDLGAPATFTPVVTSDPGATPTEQVYGVLIASASDADGAASGDGGASTAAASATYARLDVLARDFLDPIVQGTRDVEIPGGCAIAR